MFKSVKYEGFDGHPELRGKCEELLPALGEVLSLSQDRIAVVWVLRAPNSKLPKELGREVDLHLRDDWAGEITLHLYERQLTDTELVRWAVRRDRTSLLDQYLDRQVERFKANLALEGV